MLPRYAMNDLPNGGDVYVQFAANVGECFKLGVFSDFKDEGLSHFGATILLAMKAGAAAFLYAISVIVQIASGEEVIRITARWIIAGMADQCARWKWSKELFINHMGGKLASRDAATSVFSFILPDPGPTFIGAAFINAVPKLIMMGSPSARAAQFSLKGFLPTARWASEIGLEQDTYYSALAQLGEI